MNHFKNPIHQSFLTFDFKTTKNIFMAKPIKEIEVEIDKDTLVITPTPLIKKRTIEEIFDPKKMITNIKLS